jgi:hypothetical protein
LRVWRRELAWNGWFEYWGLVLNTCIVGNSCERSRDVAINRQGVNPVRGDSDILVIWVVRLQEPQPGDDASSTDAKIRPELALIP